MIVLRQDEVQNRRKDEPAVTLECTSLGEIAENIDDARLYGGIHYPFDLQAGASQGRHIASCILRHHLRPVRQTESSSPDGNNRN